MLTKHHFEVLNKEKPDIGHLKLYGSETKEYWPLEFENKKETFSQDIVF